MARKGTRKARKAQAPTLNIHKMSEEHLQARLTRTGAGKHDSRPNRQRSRGDAKRAAISASY